MFLKNIRMRLFRAALNLAAMTHLRHFRGHGIHSPFVYNLVRNAFMKRRVVGHDEALYHEMRRAGLPDKASTQIQNIYHWLHFNAFKIVTSGEAVAYNNKTLCFVTPEAPEALIGELAEKLGATSGAMVALYPRREPRRMRLCLRLCRERQFLSIDNRRFIIMLFDNKLPKQYYRL